MSELIPDLKRWVQWRETQAVIAVLMGYMIVVAMIMPLYRILNLGGVFVGVYFASQMIRSMGKSKAAPKPLSPYLHQMNPYTMVVMTGASSGIGMDTAIRLCGTQRIELVIGVRGRGRAENAAREIEVLATKKYHARKGKVVGLELDLLRLESVRDFAQEVASRAKNQKLLVICNAGIAKGNGDLSVDGLDQTFQANFVSHYILTQYLIAHADVRRVVLVSSCAHLLYRNPVIERTHPLLNGKATPSRESYAFSKCMLILLAKILSKDCAIPAVAAHPGLVATNINRNVPSLWSWGWNILLAHAGVDIPRGADTILDCSFNPNIKPGELYHSCGLVAECAPCVTNVESLEAFRGWAAQFNQACHPNNTSPPRKMSGDDAKSSDLRDELLTRAGNTPEEIVAESS